MKAGPSVQSFTLITGRAFAPVLHKLFQTTFRKNPDRIRIVPIVNTLFGESITVTGLLSGNDIITQCRQQNLTGTILIPDVVLNTDGLTLDDLTPADICQKLGCEVRVLPPDPFTLINTLALKDLKRQPWE